MEYIPSFIDQIDVDYLMHHGIKGMKWGVRRPRNEDGIIAGAGAKLAKKQRKLRAKARDNYSTSTFSKKMADKIQSDADAHGAKARATKNVLKKAGHRAAQLWDINAAAEWRRGERHFRKKAARQDLKADRIKAKRELQAWGDKANARYARDKKYRDSGQLGVDAEKAVDRYNASKAAAKKRYKQVVNAERIERTKRRAHTYGTLAGINRYARKAGSKQKTVLGKTVNAVATPALTINEKYYTHRQNAMKRKINRLSN